MIGALITLAIYLIVLALVVWLLVWLLDQIPTPPPLKQILRVAIIVVGCLIAILVLVQFAGINTGAPRLR
jgi:chromate transport protein ChrA